MKKLFTLLLILLFTTTYAQRLDSYEASNGIVYKPGDTVQLGMGSGMQGSFVHLQLGGWAAGSSTQIGANYSNLGVVIKKIKKGKLKGIEKVYFVVGGGNITNYNLMIEEAIQSCEVTPCPNQSTNSVSSEDKYDKLAKIKKLFDDGVLTEEEFEAEKAKILKK
ncbi:SHOCT domain-containing protein [Salegentibacter sp. BDJ18]|uniref:SHOCT domain-containing protein n=1 Tax=Salegentibacter sp. BDJ18 TaxID=2816376 RepID=UPI001AAF23F6|nr:SHOCT domain-containing protein [Salegentibacter sp. BDJ18]MBO2546124.1 SHOCT domain-containing protein [Salegentibacter sp. BDJ18]